MSPSITLNNHVAIRSKPDWIPFTLRWYFLLVPITLSLGFGISLACLVWYSQRNYGLGPDDGSSFILFGWRFTPTLVAVLYTQITVILFEDIKRTEPFVRLAKGYKCGGATAHGTILQTPRAWWSIFMDATWKRKRVGKTSWSLVCSALVNVLALLVISPLSSALVTSEEVVVPRQVNFTRVVPGQSQIPIMVNRETYLRAMASLTRNITTSAWITDDSFLFPFWPSSEEAQLGPALVSDLKNWTSETTIFNAGYECENMTLESEVLKDEFYDEVYDPMGHGPYNGTVPMLTFALTSSSKCRYELSLNTQVELARDGGLTWSNASTYFTSGSSIFVDQHLVTPNVSPTSLYARLNSSQECIGRDIILMSTPWVSLKSLNESLDARHWSNQTIQRSPDFRMRGLLCQSKYSKREQPMMASTNLGKSIVQKSNLSSISEAKAIPQTLLDTARFEEIVLRDDWNRYFDEGSQRADTSGNMEDTIDVGSQSTWPVLTGVGPLLGALSSSNISALIDDPHLAQKAAKIKGRFFTETLRNSLTSLDTEVVQGEGLKVEARIVVLREIGITLATLFLTSFLLFVLILWSSRLVRRPLNLRTDPSSTVGMSLLLDQQLTRTSTLKRMHTAHKTDFHSALRNGTFFTSGGTLYECNSSSTAPTTQPLKERHDWRPLPIRLRTLFALALFLVLVFVALLVLDAFSSRSRLQQSAFVYEADVSRLGFSFSTFAPISIAPTVISIIIGLWWDQLDMTFRVLQPYISMSRRPTSLKTGAGITYRSKTWIGAAFKAFQSRHWVLFFIAVGSTLCQILTVAMSALFERPSHNVTYEMALNRTLEMREVPIITEVEPFPASGSEDLPWYVLASLYRDQSKNWLPGAAIQLSFNASNVAWTKDDWNFIPLDLSGIPDFNSRKGATTSDDTTAITSTNVTLTTSAIRARLECSPIDEISNVSSWLQDIDHRSLDNIWTDDPINTTNIDKLYQLRDTIFQEAPANTSVFANEFSIQCCTNGSSSNWDQKSAIGYWSPTNVSNLPFDHGQWPISFVTKWITGKTRTIHEANYNFDYLFFDEVPSFQAAHCTPVLEHAKASVTVDKDTGTVHSYDIVGPLENSDEAWTDVFVRRDPGQDIDSEYDGPLNFTTSYGVLFLDSMFVAPDPDHYYPNERRWEDVEENAFVIRDKELGINMDLMTYSMYSLAEKNPEALLNYTTLVTHANRTFQTFFQQFVGWSMSLENGGLAYQKIDDESMDTVGHPIDINGTALPERQYINRETNRTATALISNRIRILYLNPVATYLSVGILIWLIGTTAFVSCLQRKYTSSMIRDVELIADMLVLVAGSENFLRLVKENGVAVKKREDIKTMLGWFKGRDGEVRWGIEVVGGRDAVEWVDAPKQGWHTAKMSSSWGIRLPRWRRKGPNTP